MADILVFFCFHANGPLSPHFQAKNSKEYLTLNEAKMAICMETKEYQEPIWSVQLPYSVCETAFSQVGLFLDQPFPRIRSKNKGSSGSVTLWRQLNFL